MLRPFAHPFACCCVLFGDVAQSLKPIKRLFLCKRTQQTPNIVAPTVLGVVASDICRLGSVDGALLRKRSFGLICTFAAIFSTISIPNILKQTWWIVGGWNSLSKLFLTTAGLLDIEVSAIIQLNVTALALAEIISSRSNQRDKPPY